MADRTKQRPPDTPFEHVSGCKLAKADPDFQPVWNEIENGLWRRECQCGGDGWTAPYVDRRVRLDPFDPSTSRHAPECEFVSETEAAVLRHLLRVKEGMGEGYWWVECGACDAGWQVPHYAAENVG